VRRSTSLLWRLLSLTASAVELLFFPGDIGYHGMNVLVLEEEFVEAALLRRCPSATSVRRLKLLVYDAFSVCGLQLPVYEALSC
jgi:hypothetical protein